jgi:hypothetical protein
MAVMSVLDRKTKFPGAPKTIAGVCLDIIPEVFKVLLDVSQIPMPM